MQVVHEPLDERLVRDFGGLERVADRLARCEREHRRLVPEHRHLQPPFGSFDDERVLRHGGREVERRRPQHPALADDAVANDAFAVHPDPGDPADPASNAVGHHHRRFGGAPGHPRRPGSVAGRPRYRAEDELDDVEDVAPELHEQPAAGHLGVAPPALQQADPAAGQEVVPPREGVRDRRHGAHQPFPGDDLPRRDDPRVSPARVGDEQRPPGGDERVADHPRLVVGACDRGFEQARLAGLAGQQRERQVRPWRRLDVHCGDVRVVDQVVDGPGRLAPLRLGQVPHPRLVARHARLELAAAALVQGRPNAGVGDRPTADQAPPHRRPPLPVRQRGLLGHRDVVPGLLHLPEGDGGGLLRLRAGVRARARPRPGLLLLAAAA
eukprot:CAMPEP_0114503636 /NCGR_PEP_ID=MMETSP0109-20121206/9758_1 /TAXON_ID=29199 /ORGANISM="Chlorarachnion reptans, Strain CCCM449" /LENGTH=381 /DNA_ID=CAMNT_0001681687 /DNA_START=241 /DNA_END=1383 /DNA_ORIENTATION=+